MTDLLRGTMIPEGATGTIRMEDRFDTGIDDLWNAITDPERTARWIATVHEGELRVGGAVRASFTSNWEGTLRIEVCDAPRRLLLSAEGDGEHDDATAMEAVLTEDGDGTRLVIEERGLPVENLPYHGAGWLVHLQDLDAVLAGRTPEPWEPRWRALLSEYQARAAAEAEEAEAARVASA